MGFARLAESMIRKARGKGENDRLTPYEKIGASTVGGALATWNQPIEVIRVEVRSKLVVLVLRLINSNGVFHNTDAINGQKREST